MQKFEYIHPRINNPEARRPQQNMFAYANLKYSGLQIAQYLSSGGTETK